MKLTNKISLAAFGLLAANPMLAAATDPISPVTTTDENLTISNILSNVITWVLGFAAAVAVLFLIIGGLQYITASGNEKRAEAAKSTILYAVIGLIVIMLSFVIVGFIKANTGGLVNAQ